MRLSSSRRRMPAGLKRLWRATGLTKRRRGGVWTLRSRNAWYTSHADYTIENIGTLEELQRQVDAVMNGILKPED